jgi:hypothetical protein
MAPTKKMVKKAKSSLPLSLVVFFLSLSLAQAQSVKYYIPIYGQSLSTGDESLPVIDSEPAYPSTAFMWNLGVRLVPPSSSVVLDPSLLIGLVPLHELQQDGLHGETIASGMANRLNQYQPFPVVVSSHGADGEPYEALQRGTIPYNNLVTAIRAAVEQANEQGLTIIVPAVAYIQGEADFELGTSLEQFADDLRDLQTDLNVDITAITNQLQPVLLLTDQMGSYTSPGYGAQARATSTIPLSELLESQINPNVLLVGPKYMLDYVADGIHLTGRSEATLGNYYGKVIEARIVRNQEWKPLMPSRVVRIVGKQIILTFDRAITIDTTLVSNPGNFGFVYQDSRSNTRISKVTVKKNTLRIVLNHKPSSGAVLSYAWQGPVGSNAGRLTGPRGNIRDLDDTPSSLGDHFLYDWMPTFSMNLN